MSETRPGSQRFHSLNAEQVEVLDQVLSEVVPIHGRGNFPTLQLRPRDIIMAVRARLEKQGITVRDVRLNGSTASHVLVRDNGTSYKDLDIIFGVDLLTQEDFQVIKESVLGCLLDCLPAGVNRERISSATMKEAYVQKMVKVFNEHDRWSLISLSNNSGKNLELKFVSALRRQFEFSVDSFQIILDRLLESYLQQGSQQTDNRMDLKDQTAEDQKKGSVSLPERATAPRTEMLESTGRDVPSNEGAQINRTEQNNETEDSQEKIPEADLPQQTERSKLSEQEEDTKRKKHTEPTEPSDTFKETDLSGQTPLSPVSEEKRHSDEAEPDLGQPPALSDRSECSTQAERSEQTQPSDGEQAAYPTHVEPSVSTEPSNQAKPLVEQKEVKQTGCSESPEVANPTEAESLNLAEESSSEGHLDKTDLSECFSEDQRGNEEEETRHVSAPDTGTSSQAELETRTHLDEKMDEGKMEIETGKQKQSERRNDTEMIEVTEMMEAISTSQAKATDHTLDTDDSRSTSSSSSLTFPADSTQPTDAQHILETPRAEISEITADTLDTVKPPDTQVILSAPPSLVSDKKTSPTLPPGKASSRLSQMVVLKHSSPKPPRKMCRKAAPNPDSGPVSETEPATLDPKPSRSPEPEPETAFNPEPHTMSNIITVPSSDYPPTITTTIPATMNPEPKPAPSPNLAPGLLHISAPDPAPNLDPISAEDPISALPQEPPSSLQTPGGLCQEAILNLKETLSTQVACDEHSQMGSSPRETSSPPKRPEPADSPDTLVSHTDECDTHTQDPAHSSEEELSDEEESRELQDKTMDLDQSPSSLSIPVGKETTLSPPPSLHSVTPPFLSLSPPCGTPSPRSLSPPPCLTPTSHCLTFPMLSVSPPPSFSSPPQSFSPTSSCLSSPPYFTPPMLSLSPPPLSLSPPSPCLSPPLLCLSPPVESEDLAPQVSSDLEHLIQSTESEGQIIQSYPQPAVPLLLSEDKKKEQDNISSSPRAPEPASCPLTIPSSTSKVQPGETGESAPLKATEASSSVSESKEAPKVTADMREQSKAQQASGSFPAIEVLAESMYGDFDAAMDHLRYRLIATRNPEEIRGGGLLKYSNLLVRDYRPASETQIKTLERYMCSRFFIDFPDVQEQQRKILSYLKNHFIGEERSKYQYLMTLRRVVDDSTVCLMGHERRQTLNMITVLALKVLGEQDIIPNTNHVTCFYQPAPYLAEHSAPYLAEPSYCSYYIPQGGSTLLYQPYPLHLHTQTGLV